MLRSHRPYIHGLSGRAQGDDGALAATRFNFEFFALSRFLLKNPASLDRCGIDVIA